MYHHHPYSYHRSYTISPNISNAFISSSTGSAVNTIGIVNTNSPQRNNAVQLQNHSSVYVCPVNPNSDLSAASYSTGEKTSSSNAHTHQPTKTPYNFVTPRSICGAINIIDIDPVIAVSAATSVQCESEIKATSRNCIISNSKKLKIEPVLTQFHQAERFTFANMYIVWRENHWKRVVFQDERKFNLDGPDGFSYYFHDLRNFEGSLSHRPRGNSVYIYLIITAAGPARIDISTSKRKVHKCIEMVMREKINIVTLLGGDANFILQDHNWIGTALPSAQEWLSTEGIKTQKWPTVAHDVNIMENVWGWLIREVFDGGRKFSRKDDLINRINESWSRLPIDLIANLYTTLPDRITELYYTRGTYTNC